MHRNFRVIRQYNGNNVEIYKLTKYENRNKSLLYFMIFDTHRKSNKEDFPYLKNIEPEYLEYDNYIKVYVVSTSKLTEDINLELCGIIEEIIFHESALSSTWNYELELITKEEFERLECNKKYMLEYFDKFLENYGYEYTIKNTKEEDFNYLRQPETLRNNNN